MKSAFLITAALAALALPAAGRSQAADAELTLTFDVAQREGTVMVAIYTSEAEYRASGGDLRQAVKVGVGPVRAAFKGLRPGRYAAKAFQDINGDGKLNTNMMGMPTEPFGFSNDAQPNMGPAQWSDAAFDVGAGAAAQTLALR